MKKYIVIDNEGTAHTYEASDIPMALIVHHQLTGEKDPQLITREPLIWDASDPLAGLYEWKTQRAKK